MYMLIMLCFVSTLYAADKDSLVKLIVPTMQIDEIDEGIDPSTHAIYITYKRFKESEEQHAFKYVRMPSIYILNHAHKTQSLVQELIADLKLLAEMTPQERIRCRKKMSEELLKELHAAIVFAGLWDHPNKKIGIANKGEYYLINMHTRSPDDDSEKQHVHDVVDGLECMIFGRIRDEPRKEAHTFGGLQEGRQIALWKRLTQENTALLALCKKHTYWPKFLAKEFLAKEDE